jgi:peptidoglycan/LPS O-acetylase OafA/YrhL
VAILLHERESVRADTRPPSHRRDIQALRGVAVLVVVLFHAGVGTPGGYLGVDMFFVVSGFVITNLLVREVGTTDRVLLREFWARRARRIFPLLGVSLVVGLIGSALLLSPAGSQQQAAKTATAASLFSANGYLYAFGDEYFTPSSTNPFLHTWSLAVEEQTYLLLPLLVMLLWWVGRRSASPRRALTVGLAVVSVVSLGLSIVWSYGLGPATIPLPERFAFYGPLTRLWEFGVGGLLVLAVPWLGLAGVRFRRSLIGGAAVGVALMAVAVFAFDDTMAYPGIWAAVPVLGTGAVIAAGTALPEWGDRWSPAPLVWLGDHSYGWYLWHWPAIVLVAYTWPDREWLWPIAAVLALGVAVVTRVFVEDRFRYDRTIVGRKALVVAAVCLIVPAGLGLAVSAAGDRGWGNGDMQVAVAAQTPTRADADACNSAVRTAPCIYPGGDAGTVLLIGDSHAGALSDAAMRATQTNGADFAVWTRGSCPVLLGSTKADDGSCTRWVDDVIAWMETARPEVLMIHTSRAYAEPGDISGPDGTVARTDEAARAAFVEGERRVVIAAEALGARVVLVEGVPTYPGSQIERVALVRPVAHPRAQRVADFLADTAPLDSALTAMASSAGASVVATWPLLCSTEVCSQRDADGQWVYRDWHHLTLGGAALLDGVLTEAVRSTLG